MSDITQSEPGCVRKVTRPDCPLISIVAPCYNEADSLAPFVAAMMGVIKAGGARYELVFVDDGSADDTRAELLALADLHSQIRVVAFSRNFGKEAALTAGLDYAEGDAVVVMDVDLQDPPELIAAFIEKWRQGYDVVYATRDDRGADTFVKRYTAGGFYRLFNKISAVKIPENTGDYRLMDRRVVETIKTLPERSRFMKGLFAWVGFKSVGVDYARPARAAGTSKFSFWRLWNFAIDGFANFSTAPLRVWSYIGCVIAMVSFLYASAIILITLATGNDVPGYASLLTIILFFGSIQMISVGVLGEYIARLFVEVKGRPIYIVDDVYVGSEHGAAQPAKAAAE